MSTEPNKWVPEDLVEALAKAPARHVMVLANGGEEARSIMDEITHLALGTGGTVFRVLGAKTHPSSIDDLQDVGRLKVVVMDRRFDGVPEPGDAIDLVTSVQRDRPDDGMVHVVGDASWIQDCGFSTKQLGVIERGLDELWQRSGGVMFCIYDAIRLGAEAVLRGTQTHPLVLQNGKLHVNPFYGKLDPLQML